MILRKAALKRASADVTPRKAVMAENLSNPIPRLSVWDAPAVGPVTEHATIGSSIVIKGEVSGTEALFIDGTVEGSIHFPEHRVTVGRRSTVKANIKARDVVVMGTVKGNIQCADLLDVRAECNIQGEIVTRRIRIDDGAMLRGSVEIQRAEKAVREPEATKPVAAKPEPGGAPAVAVAGPDTTSEKAEPSKAEPQKSTLAAAVAHRIGGSSVLFKPGR
jgi:cytoskeletal protein CcmA (bactofilin family)